ncbi:MAG TPA: 6-hydroxymethylpterin diphosphokinase MptE-like protein [Thermoplasmata archaeon]|nr:6-hydroxymethylpterin diphosphokinase MptE-like protein [Thermoplasmata archaeon]
MLGGRGVEALDAFRASGLPEAAVLCGGGDSLASDLRGISSGDYIIAADGATSLLVERGFVPDVVVTDLDGVVDDQVEANAEGTVVFVHAHGDNREALGRWVPEFRGRVVGTCQCEPVDGVFNFGGFTDGDRAACIISELGVRRILLAGFDLKRPAKKAGRSAEVKARKLRWAERILAMIADEGVSVEMLATR